MQGKHNSPANRSFRIVHLSDLHLTANDNASRSEPRLFGALKGMNQAFRGLLKSKPVQEADLVLITGDITDRGELDSWVLFWKELSTAGIRDKTVIVPGNHDVCCLGIRSPLKRGGYKQSDMMKLKTGLKIGMEDVQYPWVKVVDPRVVVLGLNSNNLGNFTAVSNAMGELDYNQLAKLARLLHKYASIPVKIVALHHSPNIPNSFTSEKRGLEPMTKLSTQGHQISQPMRRSLRLLCITHGVRLVLHGHLHRSEDRRVDGIRMIGVRASTESVHSAGDNKIFEINQYNIHVRSNRITHKAHSVYLE